MTPPLLTSKVRTPEVLWYQTDDRIVLRIMLTDVEKYFLSVDLDHIRFSTIHDDKPYYLCLYFFGAVIPEKTINENLGREIRVQIPKALKFTKWLRLQYHQSQIPQIVADLERCDEVKSVKNDINFYEASWEGLEEDIIRKPSYPADLWSSEEDDESDDERDNILSD